MRKFAQRHRALVAALVAVFVLLIAAVTGTSYGLIQAREQRDNAVDAGEKLRQARDEALDTNQQLKAAKEDLELQNQRLGIVNSFLGRMQVFISEKSTGDRNRSIAYLMRNFKMLEANIDETLDLYFQQCSVSVTAPQLALMAATLANGGVQPQSGREVYSHSSVRDVLTIMPRF